jgi:hypothetical protein
MVCRLVKSLASPYVSSEQNGDRRSRSSGIDRSVLFFATSVTIAVTCDPARPVLVVCRLAAEEKNRLAVPCSCKSWPRRHKADAGQEVLDRAFLTCGMSPPGNPSMRADRHRGKHYGPGLFVLFHPQILLEFAIIALAKGATDLFCFQFLI